MIDPDVCAHGRALFSKCIFCGGTAKKPPERGAKVARQEVTTSAPAGARVPPKGVAHRAPEPVKKPDAATFGRLGGLAKAKNRAAREALAATDAALLREHQEKLETENADAALKGLEEKLEQEAATVDEMAAQVAERLHKGDIVPPVPPPARPPLVFLNAGPKLLEHLDALIEQEGYGETRGEVAKGLVWRALEEIGRFRKA